MLHTLRLQLKSKFFSCYEACLTGITIAILKISSAGKLNINICTGPQTSALLKGNYDKPLFADSTVHQCIKLSPSVFFCQYNSPLWCSSLWEKKEIGFKFIFFLVILSTKMENLSNGFKKLHSEEQKECKFPIWWLSSTVQHNIFTSTSVDSLISVSILSFFSRWFSDDFHSH